MLLQPLGDVDVSIKTSTDGLDIPAIVALGMLAWSGKVDEAEVPHKARKLQARIAGEDAGRQFMVVARSAGAVVGYCRIVSLDGDLARWRLEWLVVHPAHRRRGVATTVVRYAIACATARGATTIASQTHADNHASAAFHQSFGFRSTGLFTAEDGDRLIGFSLPSGPTVV